MCRGLMRGILCNVEIFYNNVFTVLNWSVKIATLYNLCRQCDLCYKR